MKLSISCLLICAAFIISSIVFFTLYIVTDINLAGTITQSEKEQVFQDILYHLDKFQISFIKMETAEKTYLLTKNEGNYLYYQNASDSAFSQINYLISQYPLRTPLFDDILTLHAFFIKESRLSGIILNLFNKGERDGAIHLLSSEKYNLSHIQFTTKYEHISDQVRKYLSSCREYQNSGLKSIYNLISYICLAALFVLWLVLWQLLFHTSAKDRLLAQKKIFSSIIDNSSDAIFVSDAYHKFIYCNKATEKLYKFKMNDIIGKYVYDVLPTRSPKETFDEKIQALNTVGYWIGEVKSISTDEDGNPNSLFTTINAIKNLKGNTIAYAAIAKDITALKQSQKNTERLTVTLERGKRDLEEKVREQTTLLREVFERIKDGFIATDSKFEITYANSSIGDLFNISVADLPEKNILTFLAGIAGEDYVEFILNSFLNQEVRAFAFLHAKTQKWFQVNIFPSANGISLHFKDITITKKANEQIQNSKRLYEFISKTNDIILHAKQEEEIYSEICNIAVHSGGFLFAWVALPDYQANILKPIIRAGNDTGFIEALGEIPIMAIQKERGPSEIAISEDKYHYCNDIENETGMALWRSEALKRGYRSAIALPVKVNGLFKCLFMLYADKPYMFTNEELQMLVRVTDNISYALNAFNTDVKRKEVEKRFKKVSQAVEQSAASIVITDLNGNIEYVNPAFSKLTGYRFEEAIRQNPRILKTGYTDIAEYRQLWENLFQKKVWQGIFCNKKKNGEIYWEYANISPILNDEGEITNFVAVKENITERRRLEEEQKHLIKIIENTTAFVGTLDLNRNFLYANKAMKEALGIGIDTDISKYNINEFKTAKGEKITSEMDKSLKENDRWTGENSYKSVSGKEIPVWQVVVIHRNEQGIKTHMSITAIDLSKIKEAENKLLLANIELQNLSRHLLKISEIEKKDIAREIHDELGQNLTILSMHISTLKNNISDDNHKVKEKLDEITTEIKDTIGAFRRILSSLHPAMLEELGLHATVEWLANSTAKTIDIPVVFSSNIDKVKVDFNKSLALYRVVQESLTNIIRYANATGISINLMKRDNTLVLSIEDNGCGFIVSDVDTKLHHGLLGIRERVYASKGKFNIISVIGKGTQINVEITL